MRQIADGAGNAMRGHSYDASLTIRHGNDCRAQVSLITSTVAAPDASPAMVSAMTTAAMLRRSALALLRRTHPVDDHEQSV